jgi:hypothetical protein
MHDDGPPLQGDARNHSLRQSILALVAQDEGRSLDADSLRCDLPGEPSRAAVEYHLKVLRSSGLLPFAAAGDGAVR